MPRLGVAAATTALALLLACPCWGKYPNVYPYIDQCSGVDVSNCNTDTKDGQCQWFTDQYPWCFDRRYATLQVSPRRTLADAPRLTYIET